MGNCVSHHRNSSSNNNNNADERYPGAKYYYGNMGRTPRRESASGRNHHQHDAVHDDIELRDPFSYYDKADRTENETSISTDLTMPLSPDPTLPPRERTAVVVSPSSLLTLTPPVTPPPQRDATPQQQQQLHRPSPLAVVPPIPETPPHAEEDDLVSPLSSDVLGMNYSFTSKSSSRALVPSSPSRKGRALQARLQKARYMQMALSEPSAALSLSHHTSNSSNNVNDGTNKNHGRHSSFDYPIPERSNSSRSLASSTITDSCATSIMSGFEEYCSVDHNHATPSSSVNASWMELELDSSILCSTMSRTPMTSLSEQTPPLYVAVGTEFGTVLVQEILPNDDQAPHKHHPTSIYTTTTTTTSTNNTNGSTSPVNPYMDHGNVRTHPEGRKLGLPVTVQHQGRVRTVDFSPDGQYLAVGGDDCKCHIYQLVYEMDDNEILQFTSLHWVLELERVDRVYTIQFSPDSRYLAVGGFDGTVAIFNTDDIPNTDIRMEAISEIPRDALIMTIDWSPDSRYLAIGGSDRSCAIVDCQQSWSVSREIRRASTIQALRWYPGTGKYLAIACADSVAIILGKDSFLQTNEINLRRNVTKGKRSDHSKHKEHSICWSPNGSFLVVCGPDCALYETKKYTLVHKIPRSGTITTVAWGHHSGIPGDGVLPRRFLAIGGDDGKVAILKAGLEANMSGDSSTVGDDVSSSADSSNISALGDWILKENIFQDADDIVDISVNGGMNAEKEDLTPGQSNAMVLAVAFARGTKSRPSITFAHSTDDGLVTIRNCVDWKVLAEIQFPKPVEALSYSFGSRYIALGCADSNVYISDTASNWELIAKIEFSAPISSVQFECKNNERLVVGCVDGTLAFLDPRKGYDFAGEIVPSVGAPIVAIDWSAKNLAVGRNDGTVVLYDSDQVLIEKYTPIVELRRDSSICALSFGVSSRFLAVGDAAGFIGIYSSKGGWVLCHQIEMDCGISSVQWCPLGRHLAFIADNGMMKVIDTIFWADVREIESVSAPLDNGNVVRSSLGFSQDGKLLSFSRSDLGFGILDSTTKWSFALNQLIEPLTEIESENEASDSAATASSTEGLVADDNGFFEV